MPFLVMLKLFMSLSPALAMGAPPGAPVAPAMPESPGPLLCNCWEERAAGPNRDRGLLRLRGSAGEATWLCQQALGRPAFSAGCWESAAAYRAAVRVGRRGNTNEVVFEWWKGGRSQVPSCAQGYDRFGRFYDTCAGAKCRRGR